MTDDIADELRQRCSDLDEVPETLQVLALLLSYQLACQLRGQINAVSRGRQIRTGIGGPGALSMDENAGTKAKP